MHENKCLGVSETTRGIKRGNIAITGFGEVDWFASTVDYLGR